MRTHIQGFALLALLIAAIWGAVRLASPALSEALGEDGALQAESSEDTVDLTTDAVPDAPLSFEEVTRLQFNLLRAGFFEDLGAVDGYLGVNTRAKMAEAATAWGLDEPSDRELYEHAELLYAQQEFLPG
ncbi:MAG: hypothetical protein R8F63_00250 [Acidimicrobiales bacterium]|nr:hypothetical protein [Acidimicrobiales bacterium]